MNRTVAVLLAAGLLVRGAQGVALAQSAGGPSVPQGSMGINSPLQGYSSDYDRALDTTKPGWIH